jgi:hypothetical protein
METIVITTPIYNGNVKPYKFRRLNRDSTFWTAWNDGTLEDKSRTTAVPISAGRELRR